MVVPEDSRGRTVFREPETVGGRSLGASDAHSIEHRLTKKRLRSNIKNSIRLAPLADFAFSTRGNFSASFIHHRCCIAFAIREIQTTWLNPQSIGAAQFEQVLATLVGYSSRNDSYEKSLSELPTERQ